MGGEKREEGKGGDWVRGEGGMRGRGEVRGIDGREGVRKEGEGGDEGGRWSPL